MATIDSAFSDLWKAVKSTIPLNPEAAIYQEWTRNYQAWGSPIKPETALDDGGVYQVFSHAIVTWHQDRGVEVVTVP